MGFRLSDLCEMDIVLRRDDRVNWVLRNEFTGKLQTFDVNLWGQHRLSDYYDDLSYGNGVQYFNKERDCRYDIVAVCRPRSNWYALHRMHDYSVAIRGGDINDIKDCISRFDWVEVGGEEDVL